MYKLNRLAQSRKARKISQEKMAEILQIPQQQYSRYEIGTYDLPIRFLKDICLTLDVSADYLLEITDEEKPTRGGK